MTKGSIISDLKAMIGEGNPKSDSVLLTWVNDAYGQITGAIVGANPDYYVKSATANSVNTYREYDLPSDFEQMIKVEIQLDGTWVRAFPMANSGSLLETTSGKSYGYSNASPQYYIQGGKLGFHPVPDESTSNNIKIWYIYSPDELLEDSDVPEFPSRYHHIIKFGAFANFLDYNQEHQEARIMREEFRRRIDEMIENISLYQVDQPKSVQVTTNQDMYYDNDDQI